MLANEFSPEQIALLKRGGKEWWRRMQGDLGQVYRGERHHTIDGFLRDDIEIVDDEYVLKADTVIAANRRRLLRQLGGYS